MSFLCLPWAPSAPPADSPLDEPQATALARRALAQGLGPLLYGRLRGTDTLPPEAEEVLRQAYYANAARNARLLHELEDILRALAPLPILLLKGAALALAVYENPALRPMGDIDLLVHPRHIDAALESLAGLGYRSMIHEPAPGSTRTYENETMLGQEDGAAPVEVHWSPFDSPYHQQHLDIAWFWETALLLPASAPPPHGPLPQEPGPSAHILGPEAQLLHLCAHLVLHHGGNEPRLLWLHDVAEVVVRYRGAVDWAALLSQARAGDLLAPLQRVLPRVAHGWQAPVPPAVLEELAQMSPSRAEARLIARLDAGHRPAGRRLWDDLADTPSWGRRLRMAWVHLFPTAAYMRRRYGIGHPLLVPLYYPYRWLLGLRGLLFPRRP